MKLDFYEFVETVRKSNFGISIDDNYEVEYDFRRNVIQEGRPAISVKWITGGIRGGSCYGASESDHYPRESDPEPEFEDFDNLVELFVPNITYLHFKKLSKAVVQFKDSTQNDYYGNSTEYREKFSYLEDIYVFLTEQGL